MVRTSLACSWSSAPLQEPWVATKQDNGNTVFPPGLLLEQVAEPARLRAVSTGADHSSQGVELERRASAGDRDALAILLTLARCEGACEAQGRLVRVVRPGIQEHIRRYLTQRCRPSILASWLEDLTQDAVIRVMLGLANLRGEFWPWALAIARNTACRRVRAEVGMQRLKDALRDVSGDAEEAVDPHNETSVTLEQEELAVHLRRACEIVLSELEGDQQRAFALQLEGMAPKAIAKALGVKPQSVYNWKHRHQRIVAERCKELSAQGREE